MENQTNATARPAKYVSKQPVEIWAFTPTEVLRGQAHRLEGQRLSDILNDVLSTSLKGPRSRFVPLTGVTIHTLDGDGSMTASFTAVNKTHLLFVGEIATGQTENNGRPESRTGSRTVPIRLSVAGQHQLAGAVVCPPGRRTLDALNDDREFLALINVTARWPAGVARRFDFVAVNKSQIVRLEEVDGPSPPDSVPEDASTPVD